jgi:hypothetical protein
MVQSTATKECNGARPMPSRESAWLRTAYPKKVTAASRFELNNPPTFCGLKSHEN